MNLVMMNVDEDYTVMVRVPHDYTVTVHAPADPQPADQGKKKNSTTCRELRCCTAECTTRYLECSACTKTQQGRTGTCLVSSVVD